ncbi:hypothetical protein EG329_013754 [Mollisiaceae sp. DMI_Dod_QoI]|nr:hypothetical protein EG329_013754 [Helotiales sp. DMI_Dod_QoI]
MFRGVVIGLALVAAASAAVHNIDVGKGASLSFAPDTLTAAIGDTVVAGTFANPCEPAPNAFFSGYIKGDLTGDVTFIVNVTSTDPIWFYCSLNAHCMDGMAGVVNAPSGQTVSDYVNNASGARASAPASLQGGILTTESAGSGTGSITSMPVTSITSTSGSSTSSASGASAKTTMPTSTGSTGSATTGTSTSSGVAATTTPSGAGKNNEMSVVLGLGVVMLGLSALMA